jgi:hypothetical protein
MELDMGFDDDDDDDSKKKKDAVVSAQNSLICPKSGTRERGGKVDDG